MSKSGMVNLYDFDHTIYDGDASMDFILFCMKRHMGLWKYLPSQGLALLLYVAGLKSRKQIKEVAFRFLRDLPDVDEELRIFWKGHEVKVMDWYRLQSHKTDVFASASPEFLLAPMFKKMGIKDYVATRMDKKTGLITGENCRAAEKVSRLEKHKLEGRVRAAYSDSMSDMPLFQLAQTAYVTRKGLLTPVEHYAPSKLSRLKSAEFLRFLFVGGINAVLGVGFAYALSLVMDDGVVAFIIGFSLSLIPSYFLNSVITFKDGVFSFNKFGKFCISYVPNFLVQLVAVYVFIRIIGANPLLTYITAVIIAVPVTFLLLSIFTFGVEKK